jgi:hypothetical protein
MNDSGLPEMKILQTLGDVEHEPKLEKIQVGQP